MSEAETSLCASYVIRFYFGRDPLRADDLSPYPSLARDRRLRPDLSSRDARRDAADYGLGLAYEIRKNVYRNCDLRNDAYALSAWNAKRRCLSRRQV